MFRVKLQEEEEEEEEEEGGGVHVRYSYLFYSPLRYNVEYSTECTGG